MDQIYLINLERCKDRLDHFTKEVNRCNLPKDKIKIFKAIDGNSHIFTEEEERIFEKANNNDFDINRIKACFLSHYYVLKDIEKNKYKKCLVLEDDVRFVDDVKERLDDLFDHLDLKWNFIYIGLHLCASGSMFVDFPIEGTYDTFFAKEKINEYICRFNDDFNPCSLSYLVNGENVGEMIKGMEENPGASDICFNNILKSKNIFYGTLKVLATGNSKLETTIHTGPSFDQMVCSYMNFIEN